MLKGMSDDVQNKMGEQEMSKCYIKIRKNSIFYFHDYKFGLIFFIDVKVDKFLFL